MKSSVENTEAEALSNPRWVGSPVGVRRASPGVAIAFVLWSTSVLAAPPASHWLLAQDFAESARDVRLGEKLRVEDVPLDPAAKGSRVPALGGFSAESGTLDLERIEVFGPGLVIVLHHGNRETRREAPDTAYFAGRIEGRAGSFAFLSIDRDGGTRGLISDAEGTWRIGSIGRTPHVEPIDPNQPFADSPAPWTCANEALPVLPARIAAQGNFARVAAAGTVYVANIALETDAEFYDMFGSTDDAVAYVGDLFAAISAIYQRDVGTLLRVSYLSLWPGTLNSDPWNASTTSSGLTEFETYWRNNRGSVPRSTAHFLSGKPTGGGIAYVGALCSTFYGFGFTGSLNGVFSTTSPSLYWDVLGVGHEIGHNFGSPHTHCFSPPVDQCYGGQAGCYTGPASVPSGGGSIMSYCHTRPGGYSNTNLWFGRTGFYGVQSERVPQTMRSLVESVSCLDEVDGAPAVSLTVTPGNIQPGGSATLSWTSTNADDCEFTSGLSGPTTPTGTLPVSPVSTTTYELECSGPDGTASDDATLTVGPAPTPSPTAVPTPSPLPTPTPVPTPTPSPSPVPMRVESSGACGSPPGCMTTLQSAIDLSENGYTIEVASGGYDEDIQVERPDLQPVILEPGWDESFTSRPNQTLTITSSGLTGETTIRSMTITAGTVMIR